MFSGIWQKINDSIGAKIILPYFFLTLVVAGAGVFIVTTLVTSSLQERFNNQLLDAGRTVAESLVNYERERLRVVRAVTATEGVPAALAAGDSLTLEQLTSPIIADSQADFLVLLDSTGFALNTWERGNLNLAQDLDFTQAEAVQFALQGRSDEFGDKRVFLAGVEDRYILYTVGPIYQTENDVVGAVLVGSAVDPLVIALTQASVARVTFYDAGGNVIATTLGFEDNQPLSPEQIQESQDQVFIRTLQESPERYQVVAASAGREVALRQVEILNQDYQLAFGEWRLRDQSFGLFSVALPSNFIVSTAAGSRNLLSGVFTIATLAVITIGYLISQRIVTPINRLAEVSKSVAQGDLDRRSDINRSDEIGTLARSFDTMTLTLVERNRQLVEQASKQEAIVQSIADGLIVLDTNNQIVASNPSGKALIEQVFDSGVVQATNSQLENETDLAELFTSDAVDQIARRYQVGSFVYSALAAPFTTPDGKHLGRVIVLRDSTREAEAENLKDGFLASVSHELRTPLTVIKGYNELLLMTGAQEFNDTQRQFLEIIKENTEALISHINKLIDISGMQQLQPIRLNRKMVSLSMLVTDATATWRDKMAAKQLALNADIEESLWVEGDIARLSWAIDNLFSNAYCYTHPGGKVTVRLQQQNGEVCLDIQDTGIGVSSVDQPFLFTRFFRAQTELSYKVAGLGLGLFITRSIIEEHDGRVWAESQLGTGSTFSLALPAAEKSETA